MPWRNIFFPLFVVGSFACPVFGQDDAGWHISPVQINILTDEAHPLQLLDDSRHELKGAPWVVDDPELATRVEADGQEVLHPKRAGTVRETAVRDGASRTREITLWPQITHGHDQGGPQTARKITRPATGSPVGGGPDLLALSQDSSATYLQGLSGDGNAASLPHTGGKTAGPAKDSWASREGRPLSADPSSNTQHGYRQLPPCSGSFFVVKNSPQVSPHPAFFP